MDYSRYKLSFAEAKSIIDGYDSMSDTEFGDQVQHWSLFDSSGNLINYNLDLEVGIALYEELNPKAGFNIIVANDDDFWRYISVRVMPDLTFIRYPNQSSDVEIIQQNIPGLSYAIGIKTEKDSIRLKKKRFYSHTRRIWLKTLWWYIHLGWQGSSEKTYKTLQNNGTNIISHFIERPGRGYRTTLFRDMLYAYSKLPEQKDSTFRAAAKLNLAKCVSVEPALTEGGEKTYAKALFEEVYMKERPDRHAEGSNP